MNWRYQAQLMSLYNGCPLTKPSHTSEQEMSYYEYLTAHKIIARTSVIILFILFITYF